MNRKPVLFSRKIRCAHCNRNFKGKMERKNRVYVCSSYDNYGECVRVVVSEDYLLKLLVRRYGEDFVTTKENIQSIVEGIVVEDKWKFIINLKDDRPIKFAGNHIQF